MTKNVLEYLENSAARFPDKKAFEDETSSCTYGELSQRAKTVSYTHLTLPTIYSV